VSSAPVPSLPSRCQAADASGLPSPALYYGVGRDAPMIGNVCLWNTFRRYVANLVV